MTAADRSALESERAAINERIAAAGGESEAATLRAQFCERLRHLAERLDEPAPKPPARAKAPK